MYTVLINNIPIISTSSILASLFAATLVSFVMVFLHFSLEVFVYHTASLSFASITPLVISGDVNTPPSIYCLLGQWCTYNAHLNTLLFFYI